MVDPKNALLVMGIVGFVSLFQALMLAMLGVSYRNIVRRIRGGEPWIGALIRTIVGSLFVLLFLAGCVIVAYDPGGPVVLTAECMVLLGLVICAFVPYSPLSEPEPDGHQIVDWEPPGRASSGAEQDSQPQGRRRLWRRPVAALGSLWIVFAAWMASVGRPVLGMTAERFGNILVLELAAIHAFPFMMLIAFPRVRKLRWRIYQWFLACSFLCIYLHIAARNGWGGVIAFLACTLATYAGFMLRMTDIDRAAQLIKRWLTSFVLLMACIKTMTTGTDDVSSVAKCAFVYFLLLVLLEAAGAYEKNRWARLKASIPSFLKSLFSGREVPGKERVVSRDRVPGYVLDELRAALPGVEIVEVRAGPSPRKAWKYEYDLECKVDGEFIGVEVEINAEKQTLHQLEINYEPDRNKRTFVAEQAVPVSDAPQEVVNKAADETRLILEGFIPTECQKGTCPEGPAYVFKGEIDGWEAEIKLLETGEALAKQKKRTHLR